jgi:hypothetical protein
MNEFDKQFKRPVSSITPSNNKKPEQVIKYVIYNAGDETKNKTAFFIQDELSATEFMKKVNNFIKLESQNREFR